MAGVIDLVRVGDSLVGSPIVQIDLLTALPASMDVTTWLKPATPDYSPALAICELVSDQRPDALVFQIDCAILCPTPPIAISGYGVSFNNQGVAFGLITDDAETPLGLIGGVIFLRIPLLFQNWIP